jgi:hypothetical protein
MLLFQLTDGACSSACAMFVELFTQVGARTVVVGGRPSTGPMQAVGGNRGAASYSAERLDIDIKAIGDVNTTAKDLLPQLNERGTRDSGVYTIYMGINLRDQVRPNDTTPLQFKYEAADCRIFYTFANIYNMTRLWRDVISAAYDPSLCIEDSTGHKDLTTPDPEPINLNATIAQDVSGDRGEWSFGLTGGLRDDETVIIRGANVNTPCDDLRVICPYQTQCRSVPQPTCTGVPSVAPRFCVLAVTYKDRCPYNTVFEPATFLPAKPVANLAGSRFVKPTIASTTSTGFCLPILGAQAQCTFG